MPDLPNPNTSAVGALTFEARSTSEAHTYISNRM